jgi:hypothetical protein
VRWYQAGRRSTPHRGIPTGYIASVEKRLAETEYALFLALRPTSDTNMQMPSSEAFSNHILGLSKAGKVDEWERWPLQTEEERRKWWQERQASLTESTGIAATNESSFDPTLGFAMPTSMLQLPTSPAGAVEAAASPVVQDARSWTSSLDDANSLSATAAQSTWTAMAPPSLQSQKSGMRQSGPGSTQEGFLDVQQMQKYF